MSLNLPKALKRRMSNRPGLTEQTGYHPDALAQRVTFVVKV